MLAAARPPLRPVSHAGSAPTAALSPSVNAGPSVSSAFVRSALRALTPAQRQAMLAHAGIRAPDVQQAAGRVPAAAFARLWLGVAEVLDDEYFGLDSRRVKVGSFAMLCHALAGQTTVGHALRLAVRGIGLWFDDIGLALRTGAGQASILLDNRIALGAPDADAQDARRFADETLLVLVQGLLCWLAGRRVALTRLDWGHPAPPHADEYRRMYSPLIRFDAPATAIHFDARVLQVAVQVTPAGLKAFLRDAPQSIFLKQAVASGLSERAARLCRQALDRGNATPTLDGLARALGLSPATLRRRLEGEGASWGQLKDQVRRDLALQHLRDGRLSVVEIAARLGFNDASTFYRAFRKWTGSAPGAWRNRAQGGAAAASPVP